MNVSELVARLARLPLDADVVIDDESGGLYECHGCSLFTDNDGSKSARVWIERVSARPASEPLTVYEAASRLIAYLDGDEDLNNDAPAVRNLRAALARPASEPSPFDDPAIEKAWGRFEAELHRGHDKIVEMAGEVARRFEAHMGHGTWTDSAYRQDAATWNAAWRAALQSRPSSPVQVEAPEFWWNGIHADTCDESGDRATFTRTEDSWHDIPLYSGVNPCRLPALALTDAQREGISDEMRNTYGFVGGDAEEMVGYVIDTTLAALGSKP